MDRTYNKMVEITKGAPIEIINFNYARFVFSTDEIEQLGKQNCNIVEEFTDSINELKNTLKEKYSVNVSAEVTGNKDNIVLVTGVGDLYDANVDEFVGLIKLKDGIIENYNINITKKAKVKAPVMRTSADIEAEKDAVAKEKPPKIFKKTAQKPAQIKKPAKKTVKKIPKLAPKKVEGKEVEFIDNIMDKDGLIVKESLLKKMITDLGTNPMEAQKIISDYIDQNEKIMESEGWIYKEYD